MALRRVNEALVRYEAYATRDDAAVQAAFYEHDTDGSGYLDIYEVQTMLQKMHTSVEASKVAELFDRYDDDGSGEIGYYEFRMLVLERWATGGLYMEWSTLDAIVQMYDVPVRVAIASTAAVEYICMEVLDVACESVHDDALSVNQNDERAVRYRHIYAALVTNPLLQNAVMRRADGAVLPKEEAKPAVTVISAIAAGFAMGKARPTARGAAAHAAAHALHATARCAVAFSFCGATAASAFADAAAGHASHAAGRVAVDVALGASKGAALALRQADELVEAISPDRAMARAVMTPVALKAMVERLNARVLACIGTTQEQLECGKKRRRKKAAVGEVRDAAALACERMATRVVVASNRWMNRQLYGAAAAEARRLREMSAAAAAKREWLEHRAATSELHDKVMGQIRGLETYLSDAEIAQLEPTTKFNSQIVRGQGGVEREVFTQEYMHARSKRRFYYDRNALCGVGIGWWAAQGERLRTHVHVNVPPMQRDGSIGGGSGSGAHLVCPICDQWRRAQQAKWRAGEEARFLLQREKLNAKLAREEVMQRQKWHRAHDVEAQRLKLLNQRKKGHWSDLRRACADHAPVPGAQIGGLLEGWRHFRVKPAFFDIVLDQSARQLAVAVEEGGGLDGAALDALAAKQKAERKRRPRRKKKGDPPPEHVVVDPETSEPLELHTHVPDGALRSLPRATRVFKHALHATALDVYYHSQYDHSQWHSPHEALLDAAGDGRADGGAEGAARAAVGIVMTDVDLEEQRASKVQRIEMRRRRRLAKALASAEVDERERAAMWREEREQRARLDRELTLREEEKIVAQKEGYSALRELAAGCIRIGVPQLTRFKWLRTLNCQGNIRGGMHLVLDVTTGVRALSCAALQRAHASRSLAPIRGVAHGAVPRLSIVHRTPLLCTAPPTSPSMTPSLRSAGATGAPRDGCVHARGTARCARDEPAALAPRCVGAHRPPRRVLWLPARDSRLAGRLEVFLRERVLHADVG